MKTFKLIGVSFLTIMICLGFCTCSSDDDPSMEAANAKGLIIFIDEEFEGYFWINEYVLHYAHTEEYVDLSRYYSFNAPYYPFTMERLYRLTSEDYNFEINESNYDLYGSMTVDYYKRLLSKYKYIAKSGDDIYLFNRISNNNYDK